MKCLAILSVFLALPLVADAACGIGNRLAARRAARHAVVVSAPAKPMPPAKMAPKAKAAAPVAAPTQVIYTRTVMRSRLLGGGCAGGKCR